MRQKYNVLKKTTTFVHLVREAKCPRGFGRSPADSVAVQASAVDGMKTHRKRARNHAEQNVHVIKRNQSKRRNRLVRLNVSTQVWTL